MASNKSVSVSAISLVAKERVREELRKISSTKIDTLELQKLREEIIPPKTPLPKQKEIVVEKAEKHELDLGTKFTSLDLLQDTIKGLEDKVSRLMEESTQAQAELKRRREKLKDGLVDLLRLQKLIEQINSEIVGKTSEFESQLEEIEQNRTKILENQNLTQEEKDKILQEFDQEMDVLKKAHASAMSLLQNEKEKLKDEAREEAKVLKNAFHDLEQEHLASLEELEKAKVGATASEIERIEQQIDDKKNYFEEKRDVMEKSASSKKYFFDENGRFYFDGKGEKVYRLDSSDSELLIGANEKPFSGPKEGKTDKKALETEVNSDRRRQKLQSGLFRLVHHDKLISGVNEAIGQESNLALSLLMEKETIKNHARIEAQLLQTIIPDLQEDEINVHDEVKKYNLNSTPSELLKMVENHAKSRKYYFDDNGRFYFNKNGDRIYLDDNASVNFSSTSIASQMLTGAQDERKKSCDKLKDGLLKLLKLKKLIEQIDREICEEVSKSRLKPCDIPRCKTPESQKISNKKEVLSKLDKKLGELKEVHAKALKLQKNVKHVDQKVRASTAKSQSRPCSTKSEKNCNLTCLQTKKEKLKDEARIEAQVIQTALNELKEKNKNICKELEKLNIGSPAELIKLVKDTAAANKYFFDEQGRYFLDKKGCRVYKQDSCTSSFMNTGTDKGGFECPETSNDGHSSFDFSGTSSELCAFDESRRNQDIDYLKSTVGPSLRCALANMTMSNPVDPINYLANYLIQYRCNEVRNQRLKEETQEILRLRQEILCKKCTEKIPPKCVARKISEFK